MALGLHDNLLDLRGADFITVHGEHFIRALYLQGERIWHRDPIVMTINGTNDTPREVWLTWEDSIKYVSNSTDINLYLEYNGHPRAFTEGAGGTDKVFQAKKVNTTFKLLPEYGFDQGVTEFTVRKSHTGDLTSAYNAGSDPKLLIVHVESAPAISHNTGSATTFDLWQFQQLNFNVTGDRWDHLDDVLYLWNDTQNKFVPESHVVGSLASIQREKDGSWYWSWSSGVKSIKLWAEAKDDIISVRQGTVAPNVNSSSSADPAILRFKLHADHIFVPKNTLNVTPSLAIRTLEDLFGPTWMRHMAMQFMPAGSDTGLSAKLWNKDGDLQDVEEGQVALYSNAASASVASTTSAFFPIVCHNGTWWKMLPPNTGLEVVSTVGIDIVSDHGTFSGFYVKAGADSAHKIAVDYMEDENFAFFVDLAANTMTAFGRSAIAGSLQPIGASPTVTFHYTLPPGMTSSDLVWPLGSRVS
jgi:hypothetical protein